MSQKKTTKKVTKAPTYKVELQIMGRKYNGTGKTVQEALETLKVRGLTKSKSILIVSKGKETKEKVLMPHTINRVFNSSNTVKEVGLKNIATLFNI